MSAHLGGTAGRHDTGPRLQLADGTPVRVRPIRPSDKRLLQVGLQMLSPRTVQRRFLTAKPRLSAAELRYLTEVDGRDHVAYLALRDDPRELVAVARLVRLDDDPHVAEAAIVVGDSYQGQGIGRQLATLLADSARARGITRISATVASDNVPAQRLMGRIARRLDRSAAVGGSRELVADIAA